MNRDAIFNRLWGAAIPLRNFAKRSGLLGNLEPLILKLAPILLPPPATEVKVTLPWGASLLVPPNYPAARSFANGLYETDMTALFQDTLKSAMNVVDLGANIGYYSILASKQVGPSGTVFAFEPDPKTLRYLRTNLEANQATNVAVCEEAATDTVGEANLNRDPVSDERNWISNGASTGNSVAVKTTTLDAYFADKGWPQIDFMKMDVEGGERAALLGMRDLLARNPHLQMVMEWDVQYIHRSSGTVESMARLLMDLGFTKCFIVERGMKPVSLMGPELKVRGYYNVLLRRD